MTDALLFLLPLVDTESLLLRNDHTCRWPEGVLQRLLDVGFLQVTNDAATIRCPECGEHTEEVYCHDDDAGPPGFYIHCPVTWRVEIAPDARRQWRVSVQHLVETVSQTMNLKGAPKELLAGRLWRMGRTLWNGTSRDVVFARGLLWDDSQQVRSAISRCSRPISVVMSSSETAKKVIAASYLIAYVSAVLWALGASGGASGGMAFVLPVILGFPWSLLLGLLLLVAPFPKIVILVLLLVVPPAINVYLILRTRGTFWFKQDLNRKVAAKDSDPHNEEVP